MAKLTIKQVQHALDKTSGNVSMAARELGVSRSTIYARINESDVLKQFLEDKREELLDIAESALRREIANGNITAIIFALKTVGRGRGYIERQEVENDGNITVKVKYADD